MVEADINRLIVRGWFFNTNYMSVVAQILLVCHFSRKGVKMCFLSDLLALWEPTGRAHVTKREDSQKVNRLPFSVRIHVIRALSWTERSYSV